MAKARKEGKKKKNRGNLLKHIQRIANNTAIINKFIKETK
jgi:hypothetical protein